MRQQLQARAFDRVAATLQEGEQPVTAARVIVGAFNSGRFGAVASQGVAIGGAGLIGAALVSTSKQFVVVTNQRMIFLPQTLLGGPGQKILGEVSRDRVSVAEVKMGFVSLVRIAFGTEGDGLALSFPRSEKKDAKALVAELQPDPVVP